MAVEVKMPQLGESVHEGTVGKWLKQPGDRVEKYEPLLEVITDKVDTEVTAVDSGTVLQILVPEGETVKVGTVLAMIGAPGEVVEAAGPQGTAADGRSRPAVEVEGDVVAFAPQACCERDVVAQPGEAAGPRHLDDPIEVRRMAHDRRRRGFDEIVESGVRELPPQGVHGRRREHHVAHETQAGQQDLQGSTVASSSSITGMSSLIG